MDLLGIGHILSNADIFWRDSEMSSLQKAREELILSKAEEEGKHVFITLLHEHYVCFIEKSEQDLMDRLGVLVVMTT